jgi:hypothetical protein
MRTPGARSRYGHQRAGHCDCRRGYQHGASGCPPVHYAANPKVFSRWQPRMLKTHEAAAAFLQLLARPREELDRGMFELLVSGAAEQVRLTWKQVHLNLREDPLDWSETQALHF